MSLKLFVKTEHVNEYRESGWRYTIMNAIVTGRDVVEGYIEFLRANEEGEYLDIDWDASETGRYILEEMIEGVGANIIMNSNELIELLGENPDIVSFGDHVVFYY